MRVQLITSWLFPACSLKLHRISYGSYQAGREFYLSAYHSEHSILILHYICLLHNVVNTMVNNSFLHSARCGDNLGCRTGQLCWIRQVSPSWFSYLYHLPGHEVKGEKKVRDEKEEKQLLSSESLQGGGWSRHSHKGTKWSGAVTSVPDCQRLN